MLIGQANLLKTAKFLTFAAGRRCPCHLATKLCIGVRFSFTFLVLVSLPVTADWVKRRAEWIRGRWCRTLSSRFLSIRAQPTQMNLP